MNLRIVGVLVGVAVAATACGGGGSSVAKSAPAAPVPVASPAAPVVNTEGSVLSDEGKSVQWPDGLRVTFVSAEARPDNEAGIYGTVDEKKNRVRVTFLMENRGTQPVAIGGWGTKAWGGDNKFELTERNGYKGTEDNFSGGLAPTQLVPGSSFRWYTTYTVPPEYRSVVSVLVYHPVATAWTSLTDQQYTTYTFTDIGKVFGDSASSSAVLTPKATPTASAPTASAPAVVSKSTLSDAQVETGCDKGEISKAECDAAGWPRRDPAAPARTPTAPCVPGVTGDALDACLGDS